MSFYKVTYSAKFRRLTVYNYGCNFHCLTCFYRARKPSPPASFLSLKTFAEIVMKNRQNIERIHFLGGEPTINPALPEFLALCKREFGLKTFLGHTNGSLLPLPHLDGANVGVKAFSDQLHRRITGFPGSIVLNNIKQAFAVGLELKVNMILIPHLVWYDEIEGMSEFLASLDPGIPLHIQGYYPVPNGPKRAPEKNELIEAVQRAKRYLTNVDYVLVDHNRIFNRPVMDERFRVEVIWPSTI